MERPEERMPYPINAVGIINNQIAEAHELYDELESRLSPILNLKQDVDVVKNDPEIREATRRSPLMEGFENTQSNLQALADKMKRLIERLDL